MYLRTVAERADHYIIVRIAMLVSLALLWPLTITAEPTVIATIPVGEFPRGIGINPGRNLIYVANEGQGGSLSVIDGSTNTIITTISFGCVPFGCSNPVGVGVNPNTERIYVADVANHRVFVVNGMTNSVITIVSVGRNPEGVAVNPDTNRIYVANLGSDSVSVLDGDSNNVITAIPLGHGPRWVGVNPLTNLIYVASEEAGSISVIDGSTDSVIKTISVVGFPLEGVCCGHPSFPRGVGVNPQTNRIYVGDGPNLRLFLIDGVTNSLVDAISIGGPPASDIGVNPNTNRLYVRHSTNLVDVIDGATNNVITTVQVGRGGNPPEMAVNSMTNRIYVANDFDDTVSVIEDLAKLRVDIDIKPGEFSNSINPKSKGVIPVAIHTAEAFDAATVDPLSVGFGPNGATEAHGRGHIEDTNGDGKPDLLLHFDTQATGIKCGDTSASLTGQTFSRQEIEGSDAIQTVGCR